MRNKVRPRLRYQLLVWVLLPLIPLLGLNAWLAKQTAKDAADQAFDRTLQASARMIADAVQLSHDDIQIDIPVAALEMFDPDFQDRVFYSIRVVGGDVLTGNMVFPAPKQAPSLSNEPYFYDTSLQQTPVRAIDLYKPFFWRNRQQVLLIQVAETTSSREHLALTWQKGALWQQALLAFVAAGLAVIGVWVALRPLQRLRQALKAGAGQMSFRLPEDVAQHELQPLVLSMNESLAALESLVNRRQQFIADAAHQLRTPLSVMKAQLGALSYAELGSHNQPIIQALDRSIDQLAHTAKQLLALARTDPNIHLIFEPIAVEDLVKESVLAWLPRALSRSQDLGFEGDGHDCLILGNRTLLQEMLSNLIDNATRYAPSEHGIITVSLKQEKNQAILSVWDNGSGVSDADKPKILERFVRLSQSQSDGSGLGLAIVKEGANRHQAKMVLKDHASGGLWVELQFPLYEQ